MLSKILTVVLLMGLGACKKEYKKSDNAQIKTVEELNKGDYQSVINSLSNKSNLNERERYYLGSAYSQAGGVDVFSLYSVMEIQLFHKKALDWSDLSEEKNPYLKFMKGQKVDIEKRAEKREKRWEKFQDKIKIKHKITEKPTLEELKATECWRCADMTQEEFDASEQYYKEAHENVIKLAISIDEFDEAWQKETYENVDPKRVAPTDSSAWVWSQYYERQTYLHFLKDRFLHPEKSGQPFGNVKWEMLYMNILWNTYEAIPLLKKLPQLSNTQQENVSKAMEEYLLLLKNDEFSEVSLKNLMILSGVSLLSIYSSSFDLEEVNSITDLYCTFDPHALLNNYSLIRKRLIFLQKAYEATGIEDKQYQKYKESIELYKQHIPEELTEEDKNRYIEGVDKFKVDSCFDG